MINDKLRQYSDIPIRTILSIILFLILGFVALSSFFKIEPEEVGIVLRFGQYNRTTPNGLHMKFPFGIESVKKVAVERQLKQEFGFRTQKAGIKTHYSHQDFGKESLMLTGDLNAAEVTWIVQYRIDNPINYLFKVRNPDATFRDLNEAVLRELVGDRTINQVLTIGRQEIASTAQVKLQKLCKQYKIGIKVEQVVLQNVTPPEQVRSSFNAVNEAQQERERLINEALLQQNSVIPKATGEAQQLIASAQGYASQRVNRAQGEASRFNAIFREYLKAPDVTHQRIYLETMNHILQQTGRKIILDENAKNILPLLQLNKDQ